MAFAAALPATAPAFELPSLDPIVHYQPKLPLQVLTADDIAKTGYTSIAEVLTNLASNGQGTLGSAAAILGFVWREGQQ